MCGPAARYADVPCECYLRQCVVDAVLGRGKCALRVLGYGAGNGNACSTVPRGLFGSVEPRDVGLLKWLV